MPEMLIGGEWRGATSGEEIEVVNPATEEVVGTVPSGDAADVERAVATRQARVPGLGGDGRRGARARPREGRRR